MLCYGLKVVRHFQTVNSFSIWLFHDQKLHKSITYRRQCADRKSLLAEVTASCQRLIQSKQWIIREWHMTVNNLCSKQLPKCHGFYDHSSPLFYDSPWPGYTRHLALGALLRRWTSSAAHAILPQRQTGQLPRRNCTLLFPHLYNQLSYRKIKSVLSAK